MKYLKCLINILNTILAFILFVIVGLNLKDYVNSFNTMGWDANSIETVAFHFILLLMILFEGYLIWKRNIKTKFIWISLVVLAVLTGFGAMSQVAFGSLNLMINGLILLLIALKNLLKL